MKNKLISFIVGAVSIAVGCSKNDAVIKEDPAPVQTGNAPDTWKEHWFEHNQLVSRVFQDTSIAVYYDNEVDKKIVWPNTFLAQVWNYTKKTYGKFGDDSQLYAVFHTSKYSGGHPSTFMDASHDYRNVIDVGSSSTTAWTNGTGNDLDIVTHEVGHIVEGASKGVHGSPAFPIWHDSKWMEIYIYDIYLGLGKTDDAQRWYNMMQNTKDTYPRANTQWFKNWFYPIYNSYGKAAVLNKFFTLLAQNFPKRTWNNGKTDFPEYNGSLNLGEFVHFWSGAAGADLKTLAVTAFGTKDEQGNDWTIQLTAAKTKYPGIKY